MTKEVSIPDVSGFCEPEPNPLWVELRKKIALQAMALEEKHNPYSKISPDGKEELYFRRDGEKFILATIILDGDKVQGISKKTRDGEDNEFFKTLEFQFSDVGIVVIHGKAKEDSKSSTPDVTVTAAYESGSWEYSQISHDGDLEVQDGQEIKAIFDNASGELYYSAAEDSVLSKSGVDLIIGRGDSGEIALYSDPDSSPLFMPTKINPYDELAKIDRLLGAIPPESV
jgi:hypothetical protein